jgi:hypothetical protein
MITFLHMCYFEFAKNISSASNLPASSSSSSSSSPLPPTSFFTLRPSRYSASYASHRTTYPYWVVHPFAMEPLTLTTTAQLLPPIPLHPLTLSLLIIPLHPLCHFLSFTPPYPLCHSLSIFHSLHLFQLCRTCVEVLFLYLIFLLRRVNPSRKKSVEKNPLLIYLSCYFCLVSAFIIPAHSGRG